ncbi:MAG: O-antigen ligase family protein [Steroidobacteraceae bacterium]|nr:O-antigen ligase family protein [Steroidobacteraceae bacterium]
MNAAVRATDTLHAPLLRRSGILGVVLLAMVAASQWGMLSLAAVYLRIGRIADMISPEAVVGLLAILAAMAALLIFNPRVARSGPDITGWLLAAFLFVAIVGELARPELRLGNVSTFLSIGAYYLIGLSVASVAMQHDGRLPMLPGLLAVYSIWYVGIAYFLAVGDLGFYGVLPETGLRRLEFREGFTATELPIYVGFQFPVMLYAVLVANSAPTRLWATALALCALTLVAATASAAAIAALTLELVLLLLARLGYGHRAGILLALAAIAAAAAIGALAWAPVDSIIESAADKLGGLFTGQGVRARIYDELLHDMHAHPMGIGKGRFVEANRFSWLGEGVYPHNNLLGIGAELGIPAMALFAAFVLSAIIVLGRRAFGGPPGNSRTRRMLLTVALAVFTYQQFRGLFQDTWVVRETYLWLGLGSGTSLARMTRTSSADQPRGT